MFSVCCFLTLFDNYYIYRVLTAICVIIYFQTKLIQLSLLFQCAVFCLTMIFVSLFYLYQKHFRYHRFYMTSDTICFVILKLIDMYSKVTRYFIFEYVIQCVGLYILCPVLLTFSMFNLCMNWFLWRTVMYGF